MHFLNINHCTFIAMLNDAPSYGPTVPSQWMSLYFPIMKTTEPILRFSNDTSRLLNRPYIYSAFPMILPNYGTDRTYTVILQKKKKKKKKKRHHAFSWNASLKIVFRISNHILHKDFNRWDLKLTVLIHRKNKWTRTHPENGAASPPRVQLYVTSLLQYI